MPLNGSGVASPPGADYPAVSLTVISSAVRNALDTDIYTILSTCVMKDGQQTITANIPMAGFKITGLGLGTAATDAASVQSLLNFASQLMHTCDFRLTLTTGVPVTTADVNAAVTIFCTPYKGKSIALYDGSSLWIVYSSAEFSLAVGTLTSGLPYDVFCFANAGVPTLEFLAWTNATTRATALTTQDGVLVKTGATTRRYMGTFVTTSTTTTEDSTLNRFLWNYYNRVPRVMIAAVNGSAYTYTTATVRQANGNTANQLNFVVGVAEDAISVVSNQVASNTNTGVQLISGMGLDTTTSINIGGNGATTAIANGLVNMRAAGVVNPTSILGKHFISLNEFSAATGTTTWAPAVVGEALQIQGTILA